MNLNSIPGYYNGIKVIVNDSRAGDYYHKTWKERLLSWPWKPWVDKAWDKNLGGPIIRDGQVIMNKIDNTMIVNLRTCKALEDAVNTQ